MDILWSDPTDNDQELGIQPNFIRDPNGTGNIVKFGPDRVKLFLDNNKAKFILRAHECVMDGFERFVRFCVIYNLFRPAGSYLQSSQQQIIAEDTRMQGLCSKSPRLMS